MAFCSKEENEYEKFLRGKRGWKKNDAGKKSTSKAKSYDIERVRVRRRNKGWKGRGNCLKKGRGKKEGNEKKKYRKGKG